MYADLNLFRSTRVQFNDAKIFFAVDASGSTRGSIMRAQEKTVKELHTNPNDHVVLWESSVKRNP